MPSETTRPQAETRTITVRGQRLRVAIRKGDGTRTPLLLLNGIGVNFEVLQQFVDALDPAIEVIRLMCRAPAAHRPRSSRSVFRPSPGW